MDNFLLVCLLLLVGTYILSRIANYAEEMRTKKELTAALLEAIREETQRRRLDELYGRSRDED